MSVLLRSTIAAALAAGTLLLPIAASAQFTPTPQPPVVPYKPFLGERIGVSAWDTQCPGPAWDYEHAEIRELSHTPGAGGVQQDEYTYELVYRMLDSTICGTPPPAGYSQTLIDIGDLPQGHHAILVKGVTDDDTVAVQYEVNTYVGPTEEMREDVSGVWYSPQQDGRGVTVVLPAHSVASPGEAVVYWAAHDADGNPAWNVMVDTLDDGNVAQGTALTTRGDPLAPGPAALTSEPWGTVRFEYERCGHATLSWEANDAAIPDGSIELVQIMQPRGVYVCDLAYIGRVEANWVE